VTEKDGANSQFPKIEPLEKKHNQAAFSCGDGVLDTYLKKRASQDMQQIRAAEHAVTIRVRNGVTICWSLTHINLCNIVCKNWRC
jgi:hypothetical protein